MRLLEAACYEAMRLPAIMLVYARVLVYAGEIVGVSTVRLWARLPVSSYVLPYVLSAHICYRTS